MSNQTNEIIMEIRTHVDNLKQKYVHPSEDKAFEHWAAKNILSDVTEDETFDITEVGGPYDNGIDGFIKEIGEDRVTRIFQMKYTLNNPLDESYGANVLDTIERSIQCLSEGSIEGIRNPSLRTHINEYQQAMQNSYSVIFYIVIFGKLTDEGRRSFELKQREFKKEDIELKLVDIDSLIQIHLENMSQESEDPITETVELDLSNNEIFRIQVEDDTETFVAVISASFFANLFDTYKYKLFDLNVRYGLPMNDAKRNMKTTLENPEERKHFLAYNNGLTIICEECKYDSRNEKLSIKAPQIVNGCQTTITLSENTQNLDDTVKILTRIIPSLEEDFSVKIAQNNNTQNQVSFRDLMANEESQKLLQQRFELLSPNWKYLRKKGEWRRLRVRERVRYRDNQNLPDTNIKNCLIKYSISDRKLDNNKAAGYFLAFNGKPTEVRTENKKLFMTTGGFYLEIFNKARSAEEILIPFLLGEGVIKYKRDEYLGQYSDIEDVYDSYDYSTKKMWFSRSVVKYAQYHILGLMGETLKLKYSLFDRNIASLLLESNFVSIFEELYNIVIGYLKQYVIPLDPTQTDLSSEFKKDNLYNNALAAIKDKYLDDNSLLDFLPDIS